ncbi:hypothetical protein K1719_017436 [Acacia pycnantha]|nr:hypothetical protein K1719_017436 [Acacia pycnantha]
MVFEFVVGDRHGQASTVKLHGESAIHAWKDFRRMINLQKLCLVVRYGLVKKDRGDVMLLDYWNPKFKELVPVRRSLLARIVEGGVCNISGFKGALKMIFAFMIFVGFGIWSILLLFLVHIAYRKALTIVLPDAGTLDGSESAEHAVGMLFEGMNAPPICSYWDASRVMFDDNFRI